jgi:hypothetical protein
VANGDLLEDLGVDRPVVDWVAVDARRGWPAIASLEQDAALQWELQQVRGGQEIMSLVV